MFICNSVFTSEELIGHSCTPTQNLSWLFSLQTCVGIYANITCRQLNNTLRPTCWVPGSKLRVIIFVPFCIDWERVAHYFPQAIHFVAFLGNQCFRLNIKDSKLQQGCCQKEKRAMSLFIQYGSLDTNSISFHTWYGCSNPCLPFVTGNPQYLENFPCTVILSSCFYSFKFSYFF